MGRIDGFSEPSSRQSPLAAIKPGDLKAIEVALCIGKGWATTRRISNAGDKINAGLSALRRVREAVAAAEGSGSSNSGTNEDGASE